MRCRSRFAGDQGAAGFPNFGAPQFPIKPVGINILLFPTNSVGINILLFPTNSVGFNNLLFPTKPVGINILLFPFGLWSFGLWNLTQTKFSQNRPNFPQNDRILQTA